MTAGFLIVLPPSETKRDGGNMPFTDRLTGTPADEASGIAWPGLEPIRASVVDDLVELAADVSRTAAALKISERLATSEAARNRSLRTGPRMPAAMRYTGVLYDALDAGSLDEASWGWMREHVSVHSATYGLIGAGESIAAYRCSAGSRLPGTTLAKHWTESIAEALRRHDGTILDLRSSAYVKLGPAPQAITIDVVSEAADGTVRALNHFNKHAKGLLARALAQAGAQGRLGAQTGVDDLVDLMDSLGFDARRGAGDARIVVVAEHPASTRADSPRPVDR